jgi:gamma-glutamyltranspeptidase/glutathione hydrolase
MRSLLFALLLLSSCTSQHPPHLISGPIVNGHAVVASVSRDASEVGADVMLHCGNAVDGAVATAFALAVTFPEAGNLGGGGFMLIHFPDGRQPVVIDYRETAPAAVNAKTFFKKSDHTPHRLVGVPGTVRGLALAHQQFGKTPWRALVAPAIGLARGGFLLNQDRADSLNRAITAQKNNALFQKTFAKPDGSSWRAGDRLVQPLLAETLQRIAESGPDVFYTGSIADQIVSEMQQGNGLITKADLAGYRAQLRDPIHGTFRGYDVYAPPPPSSGGVALVEVLNILEYFPLGRTDRFAPQTLHLITEAMRRGYADRAIHLGDPDFTPLPDYLTSKDYAARLATHISISKATPSQELAPQITLRTEPENTTHFSVVDSTGVAVSNTFTLEESYGSKIVIPGAGFLLNNELGDFNPQPNVTTLTGQIGTPPNLAAPGKRPLSSMCPTIIARNGKAIMITGSPGGRTIINTVLCVVLNRLEFAMAPQACIEAPREHHQWFPDRIQFETLPARTSAQTLSALRAMGHTIDPTARRQGDAHSIFFDEQSQLWTGVADQRRSGAAAAF